MLAHPSFARNSVPISATNCERGRKHIAGPRQGDQFSSGDHSGILLCHSASEQPMKVWPMAGTIPTRGTKTHESCQVSAVFYLPIVTSVWWRRNLNGLRMSGWIAWKRDEPKAPLFCWTTA
jgi:hypothetical protein